VQKRTTYEWTKSVPALAHQLKAVIFAEMAAARQLPTQAPASPLDLLHDLEVELHSFVRRQLELKYGPAEDGWWVQGVPLAIRQDCASRREADVSRDEPYNYMYLLDLRTILDKNWQLVQDRANNAKVSKKDLLDALMSVNDIRNRHAHPMRAPERTSSAYDEDRRAVEQALGVVRRVADQSQ
jgi:hypothetical protein